MIAVRNIHWQANLKTVVDNAVNDEVYFTFGCLATHQIVGTSIKLNTLFICIKKSSALLFPALEKLRISAALFYGYNSFSQPTACISVRLSEPAVQVPAVIFLYSFLSIHPALFLYLLLPLLWLWLSGTAGQ